MNPIALRKQQKARKPRFIRQDSHKKPTVGTTYRKPKGLQSKMRLNKKGYRKTPSSGYGSPRAAYGLHPKGFRPVAVATLAELTALNPKEEGALLLSSLGDKKRAVLLSAAREKKITILNFDAEKTLKEIEAAFAARKSTRDKRESEKAAKAKKKPIDERVEKEKVDEETKKEELEEEKQRVLRRGL